MKLFGPVPRPLALAINKSLPALASAVGYHSVGIKPMARSVDPVMTGLDILIAETSYTATAFKLASATNRYFPSADSAMAFGVVPPGAFSSSVRVSKVRTISPVSVEITATLSLFDKATYKNFSSELNRSAVGWEPGNSGLSGSNSEIQRVTFPAVRSSSAMRDKFHRLHHARRPSRVAVTP